MIIIAYYTNDDIYSQHAQLLQHHLEKYELNYELEKIEKTSWLKATAFKPSFIENKLKLHNEPLLYLDIDTIIHTNIESFFAGIKEDIAVYYSSENELISSVIYLQPSTRIFQLLASWRIAMEANPDTWDQRVLQQILSTNQEISVYRLPHEYVYIFDTFKERYPEMQPVIEHLQASRETKYREKSRLPKYRLLRYLGIRPKVGRLLLNRRKRMRELLDQDSPG